MTPGARLATAIEMLDRILSGQPAGLTLTNWGRQARYAGSRDRAAVRDVVFDCLRRRKSFAHQADEETGRGLVLAYAVGEGLDLAALFDGLGHNPDMVTEEERARLARDDPAPDHVLLDYPEFLDASLRRSLGDRFQPVLEAMTRRAPVDLRVNRGKATPPVAEATLRGDGIEVEPVDGVETALRITENPRKVGQSVAYREGLVELQDASSQQVTLFSEAEAGMEVLDYCAGGGGKSLALYDMMRGKGHVTAHDIAAVRMNDLPARAARAGARIKVVGHEDPSLKPGAFDLVFVDAPCSGTGSWRRTPDAKWRLKASDIRRLLEVQASVLEHASKLVRPGGTLLYATCSILVEENDDQVDAFLGRDSAFGVEARLHLTPLECGDGFFAARLRRAK